MDDDLQERQLEIPKKEGWLKKQGERFKGFRRRFFSIRNGGLVYFRKKEDTKWAGSIPLQGCKCHVEEGKLPHCFAISGPFQRVYHIVADSDEDMREWMSAIDRAVAILQAMRTVGGDEGEVQIFGSGERVTSSDFDLIRVIGRGSFGKVMQVQRRGTNDLYAMKILKKESVIRERMTKHTKQEKTILQKINHPFIVGLRFAFQTNTKLYLVMDYLGGGELFHHLKKEGRFKESKARFYIAEITLAIEHLHNNHVIYRDLKPENVVLGTDGHIALTDFGLAKEWRVRDGPAMTFCGTPEYLAPEVALEKGYTSAVDWWSLGVLLFEMLVGYPPFIAESVKEMYELICNSFVRFPEFLSPVSKSLLKGLLEKDPEKRLGSGPMSGAEVRAHPFFKSINWTDLYDKRVRPPFVPTKSATEKAQLFDTEFTSERPVDSVSRGRSNDPKLFEGFTYMGESHMASADREK